ncbi:hypothetical protein ACQP2E_12585 [Actinoplanes sp. CA-015351]|uniref:hypothetical protein n=1 Tax=Actinoplanes sp. CA-015351 TaxID=3239897 RepID=UPI003D997478
MAEQFAATRTILRLFVGALRIERFDTDTAVMMLTAGHEPAAALRARHPLRDVDFFATMTP